MIAIFALAILAIVPTGQGLEAVCFFTGTTNAPDVKGVAYFSEHRGDTHTHVNATITGLPPSSTHGFHIHVYGDISVPDGTGTGGHFNPDGYDHACPNTSAKRHVGDLGNIEAGADGVAHYKVDFLIRDVPLTGSRSVIGRGMIVHHDVDDCKTQPTGNAGSRLAQCVIGHL